MFVNMFKALQTHEKISVLLVVKMLKCFAFILMSLTLDKNSCRADKGWGGKEGGGGRRGDGHQSYDTQT